LYYGDPLHLGVINNKPMMFGTAEPVFGA
jgi:hypothetical protein